jgi:hypothetical protein
MKTFKNQNLSLFIQNENINSETTLKNRPSYFLAQAGNEHSQGGDVQSNHTPFTFKGKLLAGGDSWLLDASKMVDHIKELGKYSDTFDFEKYKPNIKYLCNVFRTIFALSKMDSTQDRLIFIGLDLSSHALAQGSTTDLFNSVIGMDNPFSTLSSLLNGDFVQIGSEILNKLYTLVDFIFILPMLDYTSWTVVPNQLLARWRNLDLTAPKNPLDFLYIVTKNFVHYCEMGWEVLINREVDISHLSYGYQIKSHIAKIKNMMKNYREIDTALVIQMHDEWYAFRDSCDVMLKSDPYLRITDARVDTMYNYARKVMNTSGGRTMPFGVFINGDPGVGKSYIADLIIAKLHHSFNKLKPVEERIPYSKNLVCTRGEEKFWSNLTLGKQYIKIDDFNKIHSTTATPDPTIMDLLQIQNTTVVASQQAAVEDKGEITFNNKATVVTSNCS